MALTATRLLDNYIDGEWTPARAATEVLDVIKPSTGEVLTPAGHWSSYPPHKHDRDDPPVETLLEETYYHRIKPARGFGLQRVYAHDTAFDQAVSFRDRDCVLVPRGYHTVSAPPGYELYYLNVMAGPARFWAVANDPDHEWTL